MPRGKSGGARQGTPGKGYVNRTDLTSNYNNAAESAAGGGLETPSQMTSQAPQIYADQVPNIYDPTSRPNEPVTAGLDVGPGGGKEVLPPMPAPRVDPVRQILESMAAVSPNADIVRLLNRLNYEGR